MSKATIRDVAAAAGVSISAVSYSLHGSDKKKYSEATVKAVRRAVEKLSYVPNNMARGMRSQRANAIGIVNFWETESAVFAPALRAVAEAAAARAIATVICTGCEDLSYLSMFRNRTVDGFVIIAPAAAPFNERAHIRALREAGAPFVIVNGTVREEALSSVFFDYYEASRCAVQHLLSLGRQRIAYVDEFSEEAARELRDRREGYVDTIREAGLLPRTYDLEHMEIEDLAGIEAVVTSRASTARALMRRFLDEGIRVPSGFEILAGSAEETGREAYLPLTSVEFSFGEVGEYAVAAAIGNTVGSAISPVPRIRAGKTVRS